MDLNYLFRRHETSLIRAAGSATAEGRHAHSGLAKLYADRISLLQTEGGVAAPAVR